MNVSRYQPVVKVAFSNPAKGPTLTFAPERYRHTRSNLWRWEEGQRQRPTWIPTSNCRVTMAMFSYDAVNEVQGRGFNAFV